MNCKLLDLCLSSPMLEYNKEGGNAAGVHDKSQALLLLAFHAKENPADEAAAARVAKQLENLVSGGKEPCFSAGPFWNLAFLAGSVALAKATPAVWDALSAKVKEKLDLIMACFAISTSFSTDDKNFYHTGPALGGNFFKTWNPNHRMANIEPIMFAVLYFGSAEKVNEILTGFNHSEYMKKFEKFGFTNVRAAWDRKPFVLPDGTLSLPTSELMTFGGNAHFGVDVPQTGEKFGGNAGYGIGVRHPYSYLDHPLSDLHGIAEELIRHNYSGGEVFSRYFLNGEKVCYIHGDKTSPEEGKIGMMKEFNSGDKEGIRSSASYCYEDFLLVTLLLRGLELLGQPMEKSGELFDLISVGNNDFIFKLENGYRGYSRGNGYDTTADTYTFYNGFSELWKNYIK